MLKINIKYARKHEKTSQQNIEKQCNAITSMLHLFISGNLKFDFVTKQFKNCKL